MKASNNGGSSGSDLPEAVHSYQISVNGAGQRIVIGTLPKEVMTVLASKDQDELTEFLFTKVGDRPKIVGLEKVRVPAWNHISDVLHLHGVQANRASVLIEDSRGEVVFKIEEGDLPDSGTATITSKVQAASPTGVDWVQSVTTEKIGITYPLQVAEPFDSTKLKLGLTQVDEETYIREVSYDGITLIESDRIKREITPPMSIII